jgi:hypothetical protein
MTGGPENADASLTGMCRIDHRAPNPATTDGTLRSASVVGGAVDSKHAIFRLIASSGSGAVPRQAVAERDLAGASPRARLVARAEEATMRNRQIELVDGG